MKILFTGGGTGGHFYPVIAVAEKVNELVKEEKILSPKLYYMSDSPYDKAALFDNSLEFVKVPAGKMRLYFSLQNVLDAFAVAAGAISATVQMFRIFPDVVFGKGGYASFPALFAARFLGIPVIIHESDSYPGRVNKWAGRFAKRVAISFDEAAQYFPEGRTALTGQPIRKELLRPVKEGAFEYLKLEEGTPVIFILGGSQGAKIINDAIIDILPSLVEKYQIVHQVGKKNVDDVASRSAAVLAKSEYKGRYHPMGYLNTLAMKMAAGTADLVISRGGGTLFEIAAWGIPSIIVPITRSNGDHQRRNAFNYARSGAADVIEEANLTPRILSAQIEGIVDSPERRKAMSEAALAFAKPEAAESIAKEVIRLALSHES